MFVECHGDLMYNVFVKFKRLCPLGELKAETAERSADPLNLSG